MRPSLGLKVGNRYLDWILSQPPEGEQILRQRLLARLPAHVIDCHAHVNGPGAASDLSDYGWAQRRSSFPEWSIESDAVVRELLYGQRIVRRLWMPQPHKGVDHKKANSYIVANKPSHDLAILCGLPDDRSYTVGELETGQYVALKMYPHYVEPPFEAVRDYFPDWALSAAQSNGLPIVLHLPHPLWQCHVEVLKLAEDYPDLRVVLAHLGRESSVSQAAETAFRAIGDYPNIMMDTSMATDRQVFQLAFAELGFERIMYGSDEPFNLLRYTKVDDPERGSIIVSSYPYHWNEPWMLSAYGFYARTAPMLHLQVLEALLDTIGYAATPAERVLDAIFWSTAEQVFNISAVR